MLCVKLLEWNLTPSLESECWCLPHSVRLWQVFCFFLIRILRRKSAHLPTHICIN